MIRKLQEEDRQALMAFVGEESALNLFIIGDVECYGFDADFQEVWGSFENGQLNGVLLRYERSYIPYYKEKTVDISGFIDIIKKDKAVQGISGKEEIVEQFKGILPNEMIKQTYFCELVNNEKLQPYGTDVKLATEENAEEIVMLLREIEEFRHTNASVIAENAVESMKRKIGDGSGRIYYMEGNNGEMATVVQTTAENSMSAMVVGVATKKEYRRQGQMSQCLSKLCKDVLQEGKTLCLFYDNPEAGRVYHRLGFQSIGMWTMLIAGK
ncbi:MAG: GNAT family N-acetyltransferase [Bacillaceae bacterium]